MTKLRIFVSVLLGTAALFLLEPNICNAQDVKMIGNGLTASLDGADGKGVIFLMNDQELVDGTMFAFSAFIRKRRLFAFHIWRPTNVTDSEGKLVANNDQYFKLIYQMVFMPANEAKVEDVYLHQYGQECFGVRKGDRLGIQSLEVEGAVSYVWDDQAPQSLYHGYNEDKLPMDISQVIRFDPLPFPYDFSFAAYIDTDVSKYNFTNEGYTTCIPDVEIPYYVRPTIPTQPPPTGAPGATGPPGEKGDTGDTGLKGDTGDVGETGLTGQPGANGTKGEGGIPGEKGSPGLKGEAGTNGTTGATGATGVEGPQGPTGFNGSVGERGPTGQMGPTGLSGLRGLPGVSTGFNGSTGERGPVGPRGPPGLPGPPGDKNSSDVPDPGEPYVDGAEQSMWESSDLVMGLFIWLIILTIFLILSLLCIIYLCRRREKYRHPESKPNSPAHVYDNSFNLAQPPSRINSMEKTGGGWTSSMKDNQTTVYSNPTISSSPNGSADNNVNGGVGNPTYESVSDPTYESVEEGGPEPPTPDAYSGGKDVFLDSNGQPAEEKRSSKTSKA